MDTSKIAELRRLAEGATQGEWYWDDYRLRARPKDGVGSHKLVLYPDHDRHRDYSEIDASEEDAAFIATFSPTTILALLDALEGRG
ncbi:MAG: hypothetical protein EON59_13460 [Alphaproteobacteria bacterium]|nr:MAG: hypothetical protein EON59_13460 [Alphaproteobacteria bacterium]